MIPDQLFKTESRVKNGVAYLSDPAGFDTFQENYLAIRKKEGRLFSDARVATLPDSPESDSFYREWLMRKNTLERFGKYIDNHQLQRPVLDIGCGNEWFSSYLKRLTGQTVIGIDINIEELEQAARVFKKEDLFFVFGDVFDDVFLPGRFHLITLNASVQYFPDLHLLLNRLSALLHEKGEIHLLDSPFYTDGAEAERARGRSLQYYTKIGFPEMAGHYHHHHLTELNEPGPFTVDLLYNPHSLINKLIKSFVRNLSPFPWIRITNSMIT